MVLLRYVSYYGLYAVSAGLKSRRWSCADRSWLWSPLAFWKLLWWSIAIDPTCESNHNGTAGTLEIPTGSADSWISDMTARILLSWRRLCKHTARMQMSRSQLRLQILHGSETYQRMEKNTWWVRITWGADTKPNISSNGYAFGIICTWYTPKILPNVAWCMTFSS